MLSVHFNSYSSNIIVSFNKWSNRLVATLSFQAYYFKKNLISEKVSLIEVSILKLLIILNIRSF